MRIPDLDSGNPVSFSNSNGVSFGTNVDVITASFAANVSAGTTSNNLSAITFSNSNGVSFGLNGSVITGSIGTLVNVVNFSAGTTSNNLGTVVFSNSNGVSFGLNGSTITGSVATSLTNINISAGTTSNNLSAITFSNSNDINFGLNGSTITAQGVFQSSYEPFPLGNAATLTFNGASVSYANVFILPWNLSASFMRIPVLMTTNSTTLATTAATLSASVNLLSTINAVVYSVGVGASSVSLMSVASGSAAFTQQNSISVAANGTQYSITQAFTYQVQGGQTNTSTGYSISNTNYSFVTTNWQTQYSSLRMIDINFAQSISQGPYWVIIGMSTNSATNSTGISAASNCNVRYSNHYGISQTNSHWGIMGSTNLTSGGFEGAASFSTAGGGTTANLPISALSSLSNEVRQYFQLLRSA